MPNSDHRSELLAAGKTRTHLFLPPKVKANPSRRIYDPVDPHDQLPHFLLTLAIESFLHVTFFPAKVARRDPILSIMADKNDACPVDHKTRDAWLAQAREAEAAKAQAQAAKCPVDHTAQQPKSWTQTFTSYLWSSPASTPTPANKPATNDGLDTDRVVSTIPRTTGDAAACPVDHGKEPTRPKNHEMETGMDPSGNWVYPSEKMFFEAMKRKGYDARVADMKTVVPIHNAVNERAWKEIKEWEAPYLEGTT